MSVDTVSRKVAWEIAFEKPGNGPVLGYFPQAFSEWRGAILEVYDPAKPAGKVLEIIPHPDTCLITVVSRVSAGAEETWQAILCGLLCAYGLAVIPGPEYGNDPRRWPRKEHNGEQYPYLPRYTIAGISYIERTHCDEH